LKRTHKLFSASDSSFPNLPFHLCSAVSPASRGSEEESFPTSQATSTVFFHKKGQSCTDRAGVVRAPHCHPERVESCPSHPSSGRESLASQGISIGGRSGAGEAGGCSEHPPGQGMGFVCFECGQVLGCCSGKVETQSPACLPAIAWSLPGDAYQVVFYCVGDDRKAPLSLTRVRGDLLPSQESSANAADGEGAHQEEEDCYSSSETGAVHWVSQQLAPSPGSSSFPIRALMGLGLPAGRTFCQRAELPSPHLPFRGAPQVQGFAHI